MNSNEQTFEDLLKPGALLLEEGRFAEALDSFENLTQVHPHEAAAHYFKGLALGNLEQHEAAAHSFKAAMDLSPASLPILFNFAVSCLHTGRWQAALLTLTRYVKYHPRGDEYRAYLLLGVAAAESHEFGAPLTFTDFLAYEKAQMSGENYNLDLHQPVPAALLALCFAVLGSKSDTLQMLNTLRTSDEVLAKRVEGIFPDIEKWPTENLLDEPFQTVGETADESSDEPVVMIGQTPGADFKWEAANAPLREQLAHWSQMSEESDQQTQPAQAPAELLQAFEAAYLLVPTEGEIEQDGDAPTFSIMLRPHQAFNNDLVGVAFTGVTEARAFFGIEHALHRIVMPGSALAGMIGELNSVLTDSKQIITALIIDPAGPHPYILHWPNLLKSTIQSSDFL